MTPQKKKKKKLYDFQFVPILPYLKFLLSKIVNPALSQITSFFKIRRQNWLYAEKDSILYKTLLLFRRSSFA